MRINSFSLCPSLSKTEGLRSSWIDFWIALLPEEPFEGKVPAEIMISDYISEVICVIIIYLIIILFYIGVIEAEQRLRECI